MYAYSGVLAALYERERTGHGASLEVSMLDALGEWMRQPCYYSVYGGQELPRTDARHASIALDGDYAVRGGQVFLGVQNNREWETLCEQVLGRPDLIADDRFRTNPQRVAHNDELTLIIEEAISTMTPGEAVALLDELGIASAQLRTPAEFSAHPQLAARDRWREVDTAAGPVRALLPPVTMPGREAAMGAVPATGQHTVCPGGVPDSEVVGEWQTGDGPSGGIKASPARGRDVGSPQILAAETDVSDVPVMLRKKYLVEELPVRTDDADASRDQGRDADVALRIYGERVQELISVEAPEEGGTARARATGDDPAWSVQRPGPDTSGPGLGYVDVVFGG
jgi:hypothetical protein